MVVGWVTFTFGIVSLDPPGESEGGCHGPLWVWLMADFYQNLLNINWSVRDYSRRSLG